MLKQSIAPAMVVRLAHCRVGEQGSDWVELLLDVEPISSEDSKVLRRLFPDLDCAVERLLEKQAVLNCLEKW